MKKNVYFVSGIDTDTGRSYTIGYLIWELGRKGQRATTQKLTRTGNTGHSEDTDLHCHIMNIVPTNDDRRGLTMPEVFSCPCSSHLASRIDERPVDLDKIERVTEKLNHRYGIVLLEGTDGLMAPLTEESLTIGYVTRKSYLLLFVASGKLSSINRTLLNLEAIKSRGIELDMVLYNLYPTVEDRTIQKDTRLFIQRYLKRHLLETKFRTVPELQIPRYTTVKSFSPQISGLHKQTIHGQATPAVISLCNLLIYVF